MACLLFYESTRKGAMPKFGTAPVLMYDVELLFSDFGFEILAVETGDVAQRDVLGTFGSTSTGVCTVTEAEFIHFADHGACTASTFNLTLGQESELADFG